MTAPSIRPVDPSDAAALIAWNDVARRAYSPGREAAWFRSPEATVAQFSDPKPGRRSILLGAWVGEDLAGAAEANVDPGQPVDLEISVLPSWRRHGIGTRLARHVAELLGESASLVQTEVESDEGVRFAKRCGLTPATTELRLIMDLPIDPQTLAAQERPVGGLGIRTWVGLCPDDLRDDWTVLHTQMNEDVPLGSLTRPSALDTDQHRANEERMQKRGYVLVNALAQLDRRSVGYTQMLIDRHAPAIVVQEDTLVDRSARGRGVGRALKLANLAQLGDLEQARASRWVQTYCEPNNHAIIALNKALGFRVADTMTALEGPLRIA